MVQTILDIDFLAVNFKLLDIVGFGIFFRNKSRYGTYFSLAAPWYGTKYIDFSCSRPSGAYDYIYGFVVLY